MLDSKIPRRYTICPALGFFLDKKFNILQCSVAEFAVLGEVITKIKFLSSRQNYKLEKCPNFVKPTDLR
jgi:hypothetical protein